MTITTDERADQEDTAPTPAASSRPARESKPKAEPPASPSVGGLLYQTAATAATGGAGVIEHVAGMGGLGIAGLAAGGGSALAYGTHKVITRQRAARAAGGGGASGNRAARRAAAKASRRANALGMGGTGGRKHGGKGKSGGANLRRLMPHVTGKGKTGAGSGTAGAGRKGSSGGGARGGHGGLLRVKRARGASDIKAAMRPRKGAAGGRGSASKAARDAKRAANRAAHPRRTAAADASKTAAGRLSRLHRNLARARRDTSRPFLYRLAAWLITIPALAISIPIWVWRWWHNRRKAKAEAAAQAEAGEKAQDEAGDDPAKPADAGAKTYPVPPPAGLAGTTKKTEPASAAGTPVKEGSTYMSTLVQSAISDLAAAMSSCSFEDVGVVGVDRWALSVADSFDELVTPATALSTAIGEALPPDCVSEDAWTQIGAAFHVIAEHIREEVNNRKQANTGLYERLEAPRTNEAAFDHSRNQE